MATTIHGPKVGRADRTTASRARAEQLAPLAGLAVLPLGLAGLVVWEGVADRPEWDQPARTFLTYFGEQDAVVSGAFLMMLAAACFIWFAGSLRGFLQRAEGDTGRLSGVAFGAGLLVAAFMLALPASNLLGALYVEQLGPRMAQTIFLFGNAFLYPAAIAAALMLAATALVALRTLVLPHWFAWVSLVLALWLLIPPLGGGAGTPENPAFWTGLAVLPAVPLWTALAAALMLLRSYRR